MKYRKLAVAAVAAVAVVVVGCFSAGPNPDVATDAVKPEAVESLEELQPIEEAPDELVEADEVNQGEVSGIRDSAEVQQEALDLCQSASEFLDQGEMEDAIATLDRAYELMLALPNGGDTSFLQAKEDIRVMVADLIVKTYDSQRAVAQDAAFSWDLEMQIIDNEHVKQEIKAFTNGERQFFLDSYKRSGRYRPMMLKKFEEAGLPSQLTWLPLVESGFKVRALSRASALGLWQFISSTGLRYGLARDTWVDERIDPEKSTAGAIAYLTELHSLFGDWPKALAAYNCGEGRVLRLQRSKPGEFLDFWDLYNLLPRETRRYVPRLFATLMIIDNPSAFGMTLPELDAPLGATEMVTMNRSVQLSELDSNLGLAAETLSNLNPALRHKATPNREYALRIPEGQGQALHETIAAVPVWNPPTPQYVTHRVRKGETLGGIASRYRTSVSSIMRDNNIRSANRIWPGQRLKIPTRTGGSAKISPAVSFDAAEGTHTVCRGESLYSIASQYKSTVARLKQDNNLSSNLIKPGQKLVVRPGSRGNLRQYGVKKGDTLGNIATAHGVSLSALLRSNGLTSRSTIFPGQVMVIPDR